jgi:DNA helicase-2/ATP-dependent DNA helicase PcrA
LLNELPDLLRRALRDHEDLDGVDFDLFVVDEYQDLNACELEILRTLAARGISVVAIGDDDQSIYSFRKAHPAGIRRFLDEFAGARNYVISVCQRLPTRIAQWAQHVIAGDVQRAKPPIQCRPGAAEGTAALLNFGSEITEARGVANLIVWLRDTEQVPLSEILLLCRTDHLGTFTRPLKAELTRRGISVFDPSEVGATLSDPQNRPLLATLRLVVNRNDSLAWWNLMRLEGGMGDRFVSHIYDKANEGGATFAETLVAEAARGFEGLPAELKRRGLQFYQRVSELLDRTTLPEARERMEWGGWIAELAAAGRLPPFSDALRALFGQIDGSYTETDEGLGRYLSQLQPLAEDLARAQSDGVRLMTMVGSKGLTVRATIVVGVDNDLIPRPAQDINEERRLLYVAMTRSQEYLFLTRANRRRGPAARAGHANPGRRTYTELLRAGLVESENGAEFLGRLNGPPN